MESIANREIFIVHLDDHRLFREGMKKCLQEYLPKLQTEGFDNNEKALEFIENCLVNKRRIDFVISDINHPGENGIVFARKFRALSRAYRLQLSSFISLCQRSATKALLHPGCVTGSENPNPKNPLLLGKHDFVKVPIGFAKFPKELPTPPRSYIEKGLNIQHWTEMPAGGHFAAMEQPNLLAKDITDFFRTVA